ncbi:hypothetical protein DPEC_G00188810, partial [Dallia pectoralis]
RGLKEGEHKQAEPILPTLALPCSLVLGIQTTGTPNIGCLRSVYAQHHEGTTGNIHELRLPALQFQDAEHRVPEPSPQYLHCGIWDGHLCIYPQPSLLLLLDKIPQPLALPREVKVKGHRGKSSTHVSQHNHFSVSCRIYVPFLCCLKYVSCFQLFWLLLACALERYCMVHVSPMYH